MGKYQHKAFAHFELQIHLYDMGKYQWKTFVHLEIPHRKTDLFKTMTVR